MSLFKYFSILLIAVPFMAGCLTGPDYAAPEAVIPGAWSSTAGDTTLPPDEAVLAGWWKQFGDTELDQLISEALADNQDLREVEARLSETRALRDAGTAALGPTVDLKGGVDRSRAREGQRPVGAQGGAGEREQNRYELGFDAAWEIDIFGGRRRAVEAVDADLGAAEAALDDSRLTLIAEVARNYVELRGTQARLVVARANRDSQLDLVSITQSRHQAGLATELEVKQAQAQLSSATANLPTLESQIMAGIFRIGVLTGRAPETLTERLSPEAPLPPSPPLVPIGLPSDLLRRRPDIRQSERQLAAASARVAEATAELFPKFSLTGSFGSSSTSTEGINLSTGRFWSIGPAVTFPIFSAGRIRSNIAIQNARTEAALARFEASVNSALEDAEKSLTAYAKEQQRREVLQNTVQVAQDAVDIANEMYTKGLVSFLDVIQTRTTLFDAQDRLVQSEQFVLQNLIAVYKAVGGGWDAPPSTSS